MLFNDKGLRAGFGIVLFLLIVISLRFAQYFIFTRHLPAHALTTGLGHLSDN
jgi:hypothetical protein